MRDFISTLHTENYSGGHLTTSKPSSLLFKESFLQSPNLRKIFAELLNRRNSERYQPQNPAANEKRIGDEQLINE